MTRIAAALLAVAATGCVRTVSLARGEAGHLEGGPEIAVVYARSRPPQVDCPTGEGEATWGAPAAMASPPRATVLAGASSAPRYAGTLWEDFQRWWTAPLRVPPVDPAAATGDAFLALARDAPRPLPFRRGIEPVESADPAALARRFGSAPVLVFETPRWVLVGCWYTYKPWFEAWATLRDLGNGRVLWRAECDGLYPPAETDDASPKDLAANGGARYAQVIRERARSCAAELLAQLGPEAAR